MSICKISKKVEKSAYLGSDNLLLEVQVEAWKDSMPVGVYQDLPRVDCPPFFSKFTFCLHRFLLRHDLSKLNSNLGFFPSSLQLCFEVMKDRTCQEDRKFLKIFYLHFF